MLKGRTVTLKLERPDKPTTPEGEAAKKEFDDAKFEARAELAVRVVTQVGIGLFCGIYGYVLLDTRRQVAVAKAKHHHKVG